MVTHVRSFIWSLYLIRYILIDTDFQIILLKRLTWARDSRSYTFQHSPPAVGTWKPKLRVDPHPPRVHNCCPGSYTAVSLSNGARSASDVLPCYRRPEIQGTCHVGTGDNPRRVCSIVLSSVPLSWPSVSFSFFSSLRLRVRKS